MNDDEKPVVEFDEYGDPVLYCMTAEDTETFVIIQKSVVYDLIHKYKEAMAEAEVSRIKANQDLRQAQYEESKLVATLNFLNTYNPRAGDWFENTGNRHLKVCRLGTKND